MLEIILGGNAKVSSNFFIKNMKLQDISKIGFMKYLESLMVATAIPYDYLIALSDNNIDYREVDEWEFFLNIFNEETINVLNLFTTYDWTNCIVFGENIINYNTKEVVMDSLIFKEYLEQMDNIHYTSFLKPEKKSFGNFRAIKYYAGVQKKKLSRNKKTDGNVLEKMISLYCNASNSITYLNVENLYINQLYDGVTRLNIIQSYKDVMSGIYCGSINKDKIDFEKINWMK